MDGGYCIKQGDQGGLLGGGDIWVETGRRGGREGARMGEAGWDFPGGGTPSAKGPEVRGLSEEQRRGQCGRS